jgi:hypothetical protein
VFCLFDHLIDEIPFRLLTGHPSDLFQLFSCLINLAITLYGFVLDALFSRLECSFPPAQVTISFLDRIDPLIQSFFLADQSLFERLNFSPGLSHLLLEIHFFFYETVLDLYLGLFFDCARVPFSFLNNAGGCVLSKLDFRALLLAPYPNNRQREQHAQQ